MQRSDAMPYLIANDLPATPAGARFRAALSHPGILRLPGAHNGMAALQALPEGGSARIVWGRRRHKGILSFRDSACSALSCNSLACVRRA